MVIDVLVAMVACSGLATLIGLAAAQLGRPIWRARPALAMPVAMLGIGLAMWLQFFVTWLLPEAGPPLAHAIAVLSLATCVIGRSWRLLERSAPVALATTGIGLAYLGLTYLWRSDLSTFALASTRFVVDRTSMPLDNIIPSLLATRIAAGESTHALLGDWNGSDRPPLQSGWILLTDAVLSRLGLEADALPFAAGIVAQLLWIPALHGLLRSLGVGRRPAVMGVLFTSLTGTLLTNVVYTWPKLLSAALLCCALAVLVVAIRRRAAPVRDTGIASALFALAMLAHGAAALTLPAFATLAVILLRAHRPATAAMAWGSAAVTAVAAYAPWIAFQRLFDPPGDRLLKWHLAGVVAVDDRPFLQALVDAYASSSWGEIVASRWANLARIANPDLLVSLGSLSEPDIGARRAHEFFETSIALGLGLPLLVAMAVVLGAQCIRFGEVPRRWSWAALLAGLMLPCILLWALVFFGPGSTVVHHGSHLWILVLLAVSAAWLAGTRPRLALVACGAQLALTLIVYVPFFGASDVDALALAILAVGLILLGALAGSLSIATLGGGLGSEEVAPSQRHDVG